MQDGRDLAVLASPCPKRRQHPFCRILSLDIEKASLRLSPQIIRKQLKQLLVSSCVRRNCDSELRLGSVQARVHVIDHQAPDVYSYPCVLCTEDGPTINNLED